MQSVGLISLYIFLISLYIFQLSPLQLMGLNESHFSSQALWLHINYTNLIAYIIFLLKSHECCELKKRRGCTSSSRGGGNLYGCAKRRNGLTSQSQLSSILSLLLVFFRVIRCLSRRISSPTQSFRPYPLDPSQLSRPLRSNLS